MKSEERNLHKKASLNEISRTHTLRCDAKQFDDCFKLINDLIDKNNYFFLGELIPDPIVKGGQPDYVDDDYGVPVINTLSIQNLNINIDDCRFVSEDSFDSIPDLRKLKKGDVLLTMDGGTSIGKSAVFDLDGDYTVDSHVAILRPQGVSSKALAYLLASPMGQMQFDKAESGASGQTSVTEEDLRRFIFPKSLLKNIEDLSKKLDSERKKIIKKRKSIDEEEKKVWESFVCDYLIEK